MWVGLGQSCQDSDANTQNQAICTASHVHCSPAYDMHCGTGDRPGLGKKHVAPVAAYRGDHGICRQTLIQPGLLAHASHNSCHSQKRQSHSATLSQHSASASPLPNSKPVQEQPEFRRLWRNTIRWVHDKTYIVSSCLKQKQHLSLPVLAAGVPTKVHHGSSIVKMQCKSHQCLSKTYISITRNQSAL